MVVLIIGRSKYKQIQASLAVDLFLRPGIHLDRWELALAVVETEMFDRACCTNDLHRRVSL